jgi:hypothetical protein
MKTKLLLTAALIGAVSLSAHAGVFVGVSFPVPRVVVPVPRVVVTAPAPIVVAPVVETVPACPTPGYVWFPGYWSGYGPARVWVAGCWRPGPAHIVYSHRDDRRDYGWHRH